VAAEISIGLLGRPQLLAAVGALASQLGVSGPGAEGARAAAGQQPWLGVLLRKKFAAIGWREDAADAGTAARSGGGGRARSHCRFVPPLIHFIPDFTLASVPRFLKRQCDRILGGGGGGGGHFAFPAHCPSAADAPRWLYELADSIRLQALAAASADPDPGAGATVAGSAVAAKAPPGTPPRQRGESGGAGQPAAAGGAPTPEASAAVELELPEEQQKLVDQWRQRQLQRRQQHARPSDLKVGGAEDSSASSVDSSTASIDSSSLSGSGAPSHGWCGHFHPPLHLSFVILHTKLTGGHENGFTARAWSGTPSGGLASSSGGCFALARAPPHLAPHPGSSRHRLLPMSGWPEDGDASSMSTGSNSNLLDFAVRANDDASFGSDGGWSDPPGSPRGSSGGGGAEDDLKLKLLCYHLFQQLVAATAAPLPSTPPSSGGGDNGGGGRQPPSRQRAKQQQGGAEDASRQAFEATLANGRSHHCHALLCTPLMTPPCRQNKGGARE
jgi:hypothetical protein